MQPFKIAFPNNNTALALRCPTYADPQDVARLLGFPTSRPSIFISGGAGNMSSEALERTRSLLVDGIGYFAAMHQLVVVDGGTDYGIMQMMGQARQRYRNAFPLIGCAPEPLTYYPNCPHTPAPDAAALEANHSHFVLVDGEHWGAESDLLIGLSRAIGKQHGAFGVLINGGKIAEYDIFVASARGSKAMPVIIVEGTGRKADEIATAHQTGRYSTALLRAIVEEGNLELFNLNDGVAAFVALLNKHLQR